MAHAQSTGVSDPWCICSQRPSAGPSQALLWTVGKCAKRPGASIGHLLLLCHMPSPVPPDLDLGRTGPIVHFHCQPMPIVVLCAV
jgi:hypothetical protein